LGFASVSVEKKVEEKKDVSDSQIRLFFVETKTSQSTELFFL